MVAILLYEVGMDKDFIRNHLSTNEKYYFIFSAKIRRNERVIMKVIKIEELYKTFDINNYN